MIYRLEDEPGFPDPRDAEEDGLLAVGGELSERWLILAYHYGIFPWYSFRDCPEPLWYCPRQRFVIFPEEIHVSHSMRTLINKGTYTVSFNRDFEGVIDGCGKSGGRYYQAGAWLGEDIKEAYTNLYLLGYARSVEVWNREGNLVGGLYGVKIGDCFIGESMFSLEPSASKFALISLALKMQNHGGKMIDCQLETPHLKSMGGHFIPYEQYLGILNPEGLADLHRQDDLDRLFEQMRNKPEDDQEGKWFE